MYIEAIVKAEVRGIRSLRQAAKIEATMPAGVPMGRHYASPMCRGERIRQVDIVGDDQQSLRQRGVRPRHQ